MTVREVTLYDMQRDGDPRPEDHNSAELLCRDLPLGAFGITVPCGLDCD